MRTETRIGYEEGLRRAVEYVLTNLDGDLDPKVLAGEAGFSLFHFHRVFRGMMGESLGEFVRRIRLERSAWRLAQGAPVTETAFDAGYESHEAFTRAFQEAFGVTPRACRRSRQPVFELPNPTGTHFDPQGRPLKLRIKPSEVLMNVEIREHPGFRTVGIRHIGPYWQIGPVFSRLRGWAEAQGLPWENGLAIFYDNPEATPLAELRSDACLPVPEGFVPSGDEVRIVEIPAGTYAVATHLGPYSNLGETWGRFVGEWIPTTGRRMSEPCFELYVDDCSVVPVDEVRTELYQAVL